MISNIYFEKLTKLISKLRTTDTSKSELKSILNEVKTIDSREMILLFIKSIGTIAKTSNYNLKIYEEMLVTFYQYLGSVKVETIIQTKSAEVNIPLEDQLEKLESLIGLEEVKNQVQKLMKFHQIQNARTDLGLKKTSKTLHMAFLGNPGTAKTTVARIIGVMFKNIGLLSKGHFIEASRTDLIAEYQGQTAIKVKRLIERAKGGVLFIDEAYSLVENDHSDSYGRESLTELTKALEDYRDDLLVIVAGYPDLMEKFFDSNPGLSSRFNTFITFKNYEHDELLSIFKYICSENDYVISEEATEVVSEIIKQELKTNEDRFGNGRFVRNLFDEIIVEHAIRLADEGQELTRENLMSLSKADLFAIQKRTIRRP